MSKVLLKILNKIGILKFLNLNVPAFINSHKFYIPVLKKAGYSNVFMTEKWMISLLMKLNDQMDGVFVDAGANIGQTLLKLKSINSSKKYFGFEPNPNCVNYLDELVLANKMNNVNIVPVGLNSLTKIGVLNFYLEGNTDSTASIIGDFRPGEKILKQIYVPLFGPSEIESILEKNKIAILKIDVEGAELEVLKCFELKISRDSPAILIEILPTYNKSNEERVERQNKIETLLADLGYIIYRIHKSENEIHSIEKITSFGHHDNQVNCDYLCLHSSNNFSFKD